VTTLDRTTIVPFIETIFARRGAEAYLGEPVTIAEHMLQSAQLAEQEGAGDVLVAAALLHDIGHFTGEFGDDYIEQGVDNRHEDAGAAVLAPFFPPEVVEPVRLHVATKRYLCATDPAYFAKLSDASVKTLALQGGPMSADEVRAFEANPYRDIAIRVRLWDEAAKVPGLPTPGFAHYRPLLERLARG
jgi:phosphonate degradation associated HDIG domain protein